MDLSIGSGGLGGWVEFGIWSTVEPKEILK